MTIQWWMLDGLVGLIVLISVITGIAKGIGDGLLRLAGLIGGLFLSVVYSDRINAWLSGTNLRTILYKHIYELIRPGAEEYSQQASEASQNAITQSLNRADDPYLSVVPKTMRGLINGLADEAADKAAERFTDIAISIMSFVLILLAVWLVMAILRKIYKALKDESVILGFVDRLFGMVLGVVRGIIISCVAMAAAVPVTTIIAPDKVSELLVAMRYTYAAGVIYDINPIMLLLKYILG